MVTCCRSRFPSRSVVRRCCLILAGLIRNVALRLNDVNQFMVGQRIRRIVDDQRVLIEAAHHLHGLTIIMTENNADQLSPDLRQTRERQ